MPSSYVQREVFIASSTVTLLSPACLPVTLSLVYVVALLLIHRYIHSNFDAVGQLCTPDIHVAIQTYLPTSF